MNSIDLLENKKQGEQNMNNIMIDIETMGTKSDAAIVAIGAVYFDNEGLGKEFYSVVDLQSCIDVGLTVDGNTIEWWIKQSEKAKDIFDKEKHFDYIETALEDLSAFVFGGSPLIWGNGSDFDNVILENAYKAIKCMEPWIFRQNRCFRTLKNLYLDVQPPEDIGTAHNALDDAKWQATYTIKIANEKGIQL